MMAAIGYENWEKTGAIRWHFAGKHYHLWDKKRHFARVRWDGVEVLLNIDDISGVARRNGAEIVGKEGQQLVRAAWEKWCNDAFWLNPVSKIFDPGTVRELVLQPAGRHCWFATRRAA